MNLNTIRTDSEYNFVKLFNEALAENDDIGTINGSPFDHGDNECKYYSPENFAQTIHPTNHYHYFVSTVAVSVLTGIAFMN